jgi:hypothetical protein
MTRVNFNFFVYIENDPSYQHRLCDHYGSSYGVSYVHHIFSTLPAIIDVFSICNVLVFLLAVSSIQDIANSDY